MTFHYIKPRKTEARTCLGFKIINGNGNRLNLVFYLFLTFAKRSIFSFALDLFLVFNRMLNLFIENGCQSTFV